MLLCALVLVASHAQPAKLRLTGEYVWRTDAESLQIVGNFVCFYPDATTASRLPRPAGDSRVAWFCFDNDAKARRLLGLPGKAPACGLRGTAEVEVDGYRVHAQEGDGNDKATLLRARAQRPKALPCKP